MRRRAIMSVFTAILVLVMTIGVSYGSEMSDLFEGYYGTIERSVSDGRLDSLARFVDIESDYGKDILSWVVRLKGMDASVRFEDISVGDPVETDDETVVPVEDRLTITYPDERTKTFSYHRSYKIENGRIVDEESSFERIFPILSGVSVRSEPCLSSDVAEKSDGNAEMRLPIEAFLPAPEGDRVSFLLRWNAPAGLFRDLVGDSVSKEDVDDIVNQMPPLAEGALELFMKSEKIVSFHAAFRALKNVDPSEAIRVTISRMNDDQEMLLKPFEGRLNDDLTPLSIVEFPDDDDMPRLFAALWKGDGRTILLAMSDEDLNRMVDVASGRDRAVDVGCRFGADPLIQMKAFVSNEVLRSEFTSGDIALYGDEPLDIELAVTRRSDEISLNWFSNAFDLFVDPSLGGALLPVGRDLPLIGGKILGFLSARFSRIDKDKLLDFLERTLSSDEMTDFSRGMARFTDSTGLDMDDVLDLLGSRFSFILGSRSRSPIGDIPGLFLQIEPDNKRVLGKVAEALPGIYSVAPPVGLKEVKIDGWTKAYGMNGMASATVAVGRDSLLLGGVDYEKIGEPAEIPEILAPVLKEDNLAVMALSVSDLRDAVQSIVDANSIFLQDDDIQNGVKAFMDGTSHISSLIMRVSSGREGSISVKLIE